MLYLMKIKFIIFSILLTNLMTINFSLYSQIGLPLVKNYSPDDYKGGIQNWQIAQDQRGVVYIANNFGLLQFDGNNWRSYIVSKALKLRSIAIHDDGKIYAGCQGDFGYFEADSIGTLIYHSLVDIVPEEFQDIDETWKTYIINGSVYFCTFTHIYVYDGIKIQVIRSDKSLDVSYMAKNTLYTQIPGQGIYTINNGKLIENDLTPFFNDKTVSGLITSNLDELLITTSRHGIYISNQDGVKVWNTELNLLFTEAFINSALLLSNGNIALGTQHSGVYIIDRSGKIMMHMDKGKGLLSHTIHSLYEDQNNNLWIGQNNGISFVKMKSPFQIINEEVGLPGTGYTALQDQEKLYLGTNNGVYVIMDSDLSLVEGSEGQVYRVQLIENKLMVSHNNGSFLIENGKAVNFDYKQGTWMILPLSNVLLQGTYDGIEVLNKKSLAMQGRIDGLNESSRILVKENDSTVWMAHGYRGLYRINFFGKSIYRPKIEYYNGDNQLPSDLFNAVQLINGQLVITTSNGIYNYDSQNNKFTIDESLDKHFKGEQISAMKSDIFGNIYFITTNTVGFLERLKNNEYEKHVSPFNPIRNMLNDDLPNISIISPNKVLFAAKEGFVSFNKNLFWTTEKEEFNTIIRHVSYKGSESGILYNGDMVPTEEASQSEKELYPDISYNNNSIAFHFSSTSFSATIVPEFQYKLLGFERDWNDWTESGFKEYTNLKEGFYTFQVKSRNANNSESDSVSFSFVIIYPWYRSPIAYIIYVLLAISFLVGIVMSIDKRHQLEKKKLEHKRLQELREKEIQLDTIARESEGEINRLSNEKLESEIKHMDTELATNTMHLLNKNEFINSIKSTLGGVIKKSTNDEVKAQINKIIKNIEKNIETDGDWQNFQIHFEKVHGDFSTRLKIQYPSLSPQELKLSAYLRLNLSTKEIANLLNISMRGVEIGRYRLRKKLNLERHQNLAKFILNY